MEFLFTCTENWNEPRGLARSAVEGGGKKVFVWNVGDGNTTINYYNAARVSGDGLAILKFGPGIVPGNVNTQISGNNVVFTINAGGGAGSMTFVNAKLGIPYQADEIHFANGTVLPW